MGFFETHRNMLVSLPVTNKVINTPIVKLLTSHVVNLPLMCWIMDGEDWGGKNIGSDNGGSNNADPWHQNTCIIYISVRVTLHKKRIVICIKR